MYCGLAKLVMIIIRVKINQKAFQGHSEGSLRGSKETPFLRIYAGHTIIEGWLHPCIQIQLGYSVLVNKFLLWEQLFYRIYL